MLANGGGAAVLKNDYVAPRQVVDSQIGNQFSWQLPDDPRPVSRVPGGKEQEDVETLVSF
jgi:hypothetical protein